jgi:hypothetical protein
MVMTGNGSPRRARGIVFQLTCWYSLVDACLDARETVEDRRKPQGKEKNCGGP